MFNTVFPMLGFPTISPNLTDISYATTGKQMDHFARTETSSASSGFGFQDGDIIAGGCSLVCCDVSAGLLMGIAGAHLTRWALRRTPMKRPMPHVAHLRPVEISQEKCRPQVARSYAQVVKKLRDDNVVPSRFIDSAWMAAWYFTLLDTPEKLNFLPNPVKLDVLRFADEVSHTYWVRDLLSPWFFLSSGLFSGIPQWVRKYHRLVPPLRSSEVVAFSKKLDDYVRRFFPRAEKKGTRASSKIIYNLLYDLQGSRGILHESQFGCDQGNYKIYIEGRELVKKSIFFVLKDLMKQKLYPKTIKFVPGNSKLVLYFNLVSSVEERLSQIKQVFAAYGIQLRGPSQDPVVIQTMPGGYQPFGRPFTSHDYGFSQENPFATKRIKTHADFFRTWLRLCFAASKFPHDPNRLAFVYAHFPETMTAVEFSEKWGLTIPVMRVGSDFLEARKMIVPDPFGGKEGVWKGK